jgi:large subunit ribosomal protein L15
VLKDAGLCTRIRHGLKLLGNGAEAFTHPVHLEVTSVSASARKAVEAAGGSVTTVYFNRLGLLTHLRNEPEQIKIRFARAPPEKFKRFDVPKYPSPVDKYYAQLEALESTVASQKT